MDIFGKPIELQSYRCKARNREPLHPVAPFVNLYVKVTNRCNAACPFCSNASCREEISFDLTKLHECISEILDKGLVLNRICLTGGEPSLCAEITTRIVNEIQSRDDCSWVRLQLNTNGLTEQAQVLMRLPRWDSISVSFHHYDPKRLSELIGHEISEELLEFKGVDRAKMNISCNLIKGYIDNAVEVEKMVEFAISKGVFHIGFVGLMDVNQYCKEHYIDIRSLDFDSIPNMSKVEERIAPACSCCNYFYRSKGRLASVYARHTDDIFYCASSLLFDGQYLRQGFHSDNIIY